MTFPRGFQWGVASSSYQIEGAWDAEGKGPHIWDAWCMVPGNIRDGTDGKRAMDHYHRLEEDVALMAALGIKAYRFSICWPRVLPRGIGDVNEAGIAFYNRLLDALLREGIEPWVTLYHWEMPLHLEMTYGGFLYEGIDQCFAGYADLCFQRFGDRVKHWITLNEANAVAFCGYRHGLHAPGRRCQPDVEPYVVTRNLLRCHAAAVRVYREKYAAQQSGRIGIANNTYWHEPMSNDPADVGAAERGVDFVLGMFTDPLVHGHYPESLMPYLSERLVPLTDDDVAIMRGSLDFLGLNHYRSFGGRSPDPCLIADGEWAGPGTLDREIHEVVCRLETEFSSENEGFGSIYPDGMRRILLHAQRRYGLPLVITENGSTTPSQERSAALADADRIRYLQAYIGKVGEAIAQGAEVQAYFLWSFLDSFEWMSGYEMTLGIVHVDMKTMERTPKNSAEWYKSVIERHGVPA